MKSALDRPTVHKIETEVRDDNRIWTNHESVCMLSRMSYKSARVRYKHMLPHPPPPAFSSPLKNEDLPGRATPVLTFDNRFFHDSVYQPGQATNVVPGQTSRYVSQWIGYSPQYRTLKKTMSIFLL